MIIDFKKYNKLLDPNRETDKIKVRYLKDYGSKKKGCEDFITSKNYLLFSERGICESIEKTNPSEIAFGDFELIDALDTNAEKHREWLKSYEGLSCSIAKNKIHMTKWATEPVYYNDNLFSEDINCIGRKKDRIIIEFDAIKDEDGNIVEGEENNPKESLESVKQILEHYGIGYILSSHKSKNSDYLWVEFNREITTEEAQSFLSWLCPEGANVDLNFTFDKKVFPVLFAKHWKGDKVRELPIDFLKGNKINFDSLNLPKIELEKITRVNKEGFEYTTFEKKKELKDFLKFTGVNKKTNKKQFSVSIDKVANYIEGRINVRTIYGIKEETIELYSEGVWKVAGKGCIKSFVESLLGYYSTNNVVSEILEKIKRRTEVTREECEIVPDYKRCVENGVIDLSNINDIKLVPHSKDFNFRTKFPIEYNPEAKCPKIMKFIEETFYKEDIKQVQEWFGFHLPRRYFLKKALIVHGQKNTGKTIFLNLLTMFLGGNVSGLSLQEISLGKPFDLKDLKDKDANICDDLSSQDMKAVGGFKMAVGDGFINGEYKFGDKIRFRNTAKDTNACNRIPSPGEDIDDEAYYERILLLPIDNHVPKDKRDRSLIDKLTTPEELSGLLNWAIEGYKRLVKNNCFTNEKSPEETKFLMVQNGNSLARFASEVLIHTDGERVTKDIMYKVYCDWCMNHKPQLSPDTKDKIGKTLTKVAPFTQASSNGKERYWLNVKINDTYYTFQNNISKVFVNDNNTLDIMNISEPVIPVSKKVYISSGDASKVSNFSDIEFTDKGVVDKLSTPIGAKTRDILAKELKEAKEDFEEARRSGW